MDQTPTGPWQSLPWFMVTAPAPRSEIVDRPRLINLIETGIGRAPLTLLSAPSGYGKTVAAAQWAQGTANATWLSATTAVDTVSVLRGGLLAALPQQAQHRLSTLDQEEDAPSILELLRSLTAPAVLIIDDAHLLDVEVVRGTVGSEAVLNSDLLRLLLVGQTGLERQYARELATGLASAIRADELALTPSEADQVVQLVGGRAESDGAQRLVTQTGGWPVAIRLRALAGGAEPPVKTDLGHGTLDDETQIDPLLADYIDSVVLSRFAPEVVEFVLDATTCSRANSDLVEALTGRPDSAARLEQCRRAGLFLDRYADPVGRSVYRWHEVFAAHTRAILERRNPERSRLLNLIAADWLARDYPAEAVGHALRAGEPDLAAAIIRRNWLRLLLTSQTRTLSRLCLLLPQRLQEDRDILMIRACCCDLVADHQAAKVLRRRAEAAQSEGRRGSAFVHRFAELLLTYDPALKSDAADLAYDALGERGDEDDYPHGLFLLGWVELRLRRDPERAIATLTAAHHEAEAQGLARLALHARANRAFALTYGGHFVEAVRALDELEHLPDFELGDWERFDGGLAVFARGYVHHWRGELEDAFACFAKLVDDGGSNSSFLGLARVYYALTAAALGRAETYDQADLILSKVNNFDQHGVPWGAYKRIAAARLFEARGDITEARRIADPLLNRNGIPVTHAFLAELYRRIGQPSSAYIALKKMRPRERPRYAQVSAYVTLAALQSVTSRPEEARRHLDRALDIAAPDGAYFPFLAQDPGMTALLEAHARSGSRHERRLAEIFALRDAMQEGPVDALTAREKELLRYLRTAMTAKEIADELHLSLNTVKTHVRSIYRKLGVRNRRSAVRLTS